MARTSDVSEFIMGEIGNLTDNGAIDHSSLIQTVMLKFPKFANRRAAANKINSVLNNKSVSDRFVKIKGTDKKHYICRKIIPGGITNGRESGTETTEEKAVA